MGGGKDQVDVLKKFLRWFVVGVSAMFKQYIAISDDLGRVSNQTNKLSLPVIFRGKDQPKLSVNTPKSTNEEKCLKETT